MGNQTQACLILVSVISKARNNSVCPPTTVSRIRSIPQYIKIHRCAIPFSIDFTALIFKTHTEKHVLTNRLAIGPPQEATSHGNK